MNEISFEQVVMEGGVIAKYEDKKPHKTTGDGTLDVHLVWNAYEYDEWSIIAKNRTNTGAYLYVEASNAENPSEDDWALIKLVELEAGDNVSVVIKDRYLKIRIRCWSLGDGEKKHIAYDVCGFRKAGDALW